MKLVVPRVADFEVTGEARAEAWTQAPWQPLVRVDDAPCPYATRGKVLYSATGIYFLFDCEDRQLTCTKTENYADLYNEDVVEVFLWPCEEQDIYFEYELSPLNVELPILVPNAGGKFTGWQPWHYEQGRLVRRATAVRGGPKASMAKVDGWMAEFFLPFALLRGLRHTPPDPGSRWRGNLYRIDYDSGRPAQWAWCPDTGTEFHDFRKFGTFEFEA